MKAQQTHNGEVMALALHMADHYSIPASHGTPNTASVLIVLHIANLNLIPGIP